MPVKVGLYDMKGQSLGEIELNEAIFGIEPHKASMHQVVKAHLLAKRQGTQSTLTRAEVSGGGRKPWRQKGTGRARQGSTRSPQWTHGGIALGPKPRTYGISVNRKVRRLAMKSALSSKAAEGSVIVIDKLAMDEIKTKNFVAFLKAVGVTGKALVVLPEVRETVIRSARNLPGVQTAQVGSLCVYDILGHGTCILDRESVSILEEVYAQ